MSLRDDLAADLADICTADGEEFWIDDGSVEGLTVYGFLRDPSERIDLASGGAIGNRTSVLLPAASVAQIADLEGRALHAAGIEYEIAERLPAGADNKSKVVLVLTGKGEL